jgi:hypothetical protein
MDEHLEGYLQIATAEIKFNIEVLLKQKQSQISQVIIELPKEISGVINANTFETVCVLFTGCCYGVVSGKAYHATATIF